MEDERSSSRCNARSGGCRRRKAAGAPNAQAAEKIPLNSSPVDQ
jgi:hypothetical protein